MKGLNTAFIVVELSKAFQPKHIVYTTFRHHDIDTSYETLCVEHTTVWVTFAHSALVDATFIKVMTSVGIYLLPK